MPWMNFDLQDGKAPIGFNLKPDDCERFMEFLAECQALKESTARFRDQRCLPEGLRYSLPALVMNGHQLKQALEFVQADDSEEALDTEVSLALRPGGYDMEGERIDAGLCIWLTEYPDEGSILLDGQSLHDQ